MELTVTKGNRLLYWSEHYILACENRQHISRLVGVDANGTGVSVWPGLLQDKHTKTTDDVFFW